LSQIFNEVVRKMVPNWPAEKFVNDMNCFVTPYRLPFMPPRYGRSGNALPKDFPDYLVYVTRETLLGSTTSLSRVSDGAHNFFLQARQMMAADRMMRTFFPWATPSARAAWPYAQTAPLALPAPQTMQLLPYFGSMPAALPEPTQTQAAVPNPFAALNAAAPALAAFMSASATALASVPALFQSTPTVI